MNSSSAEPKTHEEWASRLSRLEQRLARYQAARQAAEDLLEQKSFELYQVNESLRALTDQLEDQVEHRTQDLKVALEQAQVATKTKDEFMANLSHEVRTPLNAIMGLTQLLAKSDSLGEEDHHYLTLLDNSATTLLTLINDVLDFSKIESGKLIVERVDFELASWLDISTAPYLMQARSKGLRLNVQTHPDLPKRVTGDPGKLRQILSNLLTNAIKFTEQGEITVKVRPSQRQTDLDSQRIRLIFDVRDTGIGIPIAQQERIFEAFVQADASTTRRYGGTGLGLTICARLVAMMDGAIRVASRPQQGSVFRFSAVLGIASATNASVAAAPTTQVNQLKGLRVLVAEDNKINQFLIDKMLNRLGCEVVLTNNGVEAVQQWQSESFDLILMDMQMPLMDGFDATAQIRLMEQKTDGHTPIVALTAHAMDSDREKCLAAGMDAYASKPITEQSLWVAVQEAMATAKLGAPLVLQH